VQIQDWDLFLVIAKLVHFLLVELCLLHALHVPSVRNKTALGSPHVCHVLPECTARL
jgi:hypothetical protein